MFFVPIFLLISCSRVIYIVPYGNNDFLLKISSSQLAGGKEKAASLSYKISNDFCYKQNHLYISNIYNVSVRDNFFYDRNFLSPTITSGSAEVIFTCILH